MKIELFVINNGLLIVLVAARVLQSAQVAGFVDTQLWVLAVTPYHQTTPRG